MSLFAHGKFESHSGLTLPWKIDCDALTDDDLRVLAAEIATRIKFGQVVGVPRGGLRLAYMLEYYITTRHPVTLIIDDVLTTGQSMEQFRAGKEAIGVVIFARGPCPPWVKPIFTLWS